MSTHTLAGVGGKRNTVNQHTVGLARCLGVVILQGGISFNPSLQKSREDNSNTMTTTATELGLGAAGLAIRMGPAVLSPDNVRARS